MKSIIKSHGENFSNKTSLRNAVNLSLNLGANTLMLNASKSSK